jgi:hypothetical protein
MEERLSVKYPLFAALVDGKYVAYAACQIENGIFGWKSIFTR